MDSVGCALTSNEPTIAVSVARVMTRVPRVAARYTIPIRIGVESPLICGDIPNRAPFAWPGALVGVAIPVRTRYVCADAMVPARGKITNRSERSRASSGGIGWSSDRGAHHTSCVSKPAGAALSIAPRMYVVRALSDSVNTGIPSARTEQLPSARNLPAMDTAAGLKFLDDCA